MYEKCDRLQRRSVDGESSCWLEDRFQRFDDSGFGVMVAWAILILQGFNYFSFMSSGRYNEPLD